MKHISWKASTRSGKVYVKTYQEDRQLQVILAVDASASTGVGAPKSKHRIALEFAALVTMLARQSQDAVGLCLFAGKVEEFIRPRARRGQFSEVMQALIRQRELPQTTDLNPAIDHLLRHTRRGSLIFLISDFKAPPFEHSLRRLSIHNDVVAVNLSGSTDQELPKTGLVQFRDAESGEQVIVDTGSAKVRQALREQAAKERMALGALCSNFGVDLISVNDNPMRPLVELMQRRSKRYR